MFMRGARRRLKARLTVRTMIYAGWAASTLTLLAIFVVTLDGNRVYGGETTWGADGVGSESRRLRESEIGSVMEFESRSLRGFESMFPRKSSLEDGEEAPMTEQRRLGVPRGARKSTQLGETRRVQSEPRNGSVKEGNHGSSISGIGRIPLRTDVKRRFQNVPRENFVVETNEESGRGWWSSWLKRGTRLKTTATETRIKRRTINSARNSGTGESMKETQIRGTDVISLIERLKEEDRGAGAGAGADEESWTLGLHLPATQIQMPDLGEAAAEAEITAVSVQGVPLVEDGIYWSKDTEKLVPTGLTDDMARAFRETVSSTPVKSMEPAQWNRCGRPKNQFLLLEDGTSICARYRHPQETLIRGEILTYFLSRILGFDNVPTVALSYLNDSDPLWRNQNFTSSADWSPGAFVALIQWMEDLNHERSRVKMPALLLSHYESAATMTGRTLDRSRLDADQLSSFLQWSDLILFDYISGHYDRVASMQDGAAREMRPSVMAESIRNLRQIHGNGKLVLIDNESGLIDAYELMYRGSSSGLQFLGFHRRLLQTICLFRRRTVSRIRWLGSWENPDQILEEYTSLHEPLYRKLTEAPEVELFRYYFRVRLKEVIEWIDHCNSLR